MVQLLIETSVPPHPPTAHEARRTRPSGGGRARAGQGRAGRAHEARHGTRGAQDIRAHEARSSQPHATPEPSHHGAQASRGRGTAGQQQQPRQRTAANNQSGVCFLRSTHPPITSSTTPSPSHSGARARTQGNPIPSEPHRAQTRQADKRSEEPSRPSEDDAQQQAQPTTRPGRRPPPTTQEDRARRPSIPNDPEPRTASARDTTPDSSPEATRGRRSHARQAGHQRQPSHGRGQQERPQQPSRRPAPTSLDIDKRRTKEGGPPPSSGSRPQARAVCEALVSRPRVYGDRVEPIARNQTQVIPADIRHLRQQVSRRHRAAPEHR